jgi:hypothetical protein
MIRIVFGLPSFGLVSKNWILKDMKLRGMAHIRYTHEATVTISMQSRYFTLMDREKGEM